MAPGERTWTNPRTGAWVKAIDAGPDQQIERLIQRDRRRPAPAPAPHGVAGRPVRGPFVSSLGHCMENDTVDKQGEFPDLQLFVILRATRAQSYIAGVPITIQKPVIAVGAWLGRLRGYRPGY